jgi:hypothetical protein
MRIIHSARLHNIFLPDQSESRHFGLHHPATIATGLVRYALPSQGQSTPSPRPMYFNTAVNFKLKVVWSDHQRTCKITIKEHDYATIIFPS